MHHHCCLTPAHQLPWPSSWCPAFCGLVPQQIPHLHELCACSPPGACPWGHGVEQNQPWPPGTPASSCHLPLLESFVFLGDFRLWQCVKDQDDNAECVCSGAYCICEPFTCHAVSFSPLFYSQPCTEKPTAQGRACSSHQEVGMHSPALRAHPSMCLRLGWKKKKILL